MRRSRVALVVGAAGLVVPGVAAVATAALPEQAPKAAAVKPVAVGQAAITFTPGTVTLSKNRKTVAVRVQYQCKNSKLYKHYTHGSVQQGEGDEAVTYSIGFRGENGTRAARCTGALVTETLTMPRTWWTETQGKSLVSGPADLTFAVSRHNAPGHGPGWYTVHSTASVAKTARVLTP